MDGVELLRQLRQVDAGLPALLVTAYASDQSLHHARQEGLFAILQKPVDIGRLLELLDRVRRDATVALVEDDPVLAENLAEGLRDHGFSVVSAAHVEEAGALRVVQPLCAVVDWRVPGGAFGEALVRLRERFPGLPCLVISGYEVDGPIDGAVALIRKPFRMEELLATLERAHVARGAA
jgi:DNA-binding NtrC family response regulator